MFISRKDGVQQASLRNSRPGRRLSVRALRQVLHRLDRSQPPRQARPRHGRRGTALRRLRALLLTRIPLQPSQPREARHGPGVLLRNV